jgi:carboxymethylenebutenolidase
MGETVQIATEGMHCISAWRARPAGTPMGGVVVVQEIFGVNPHIRSVVDRFAGEGFDAIAPALFDHIESGVELGYDDTGVNRGRELTAELGFGRAVEAVASAAQSIASAGTIGVVGYCWGGTVAFLGNTRLGLPSVSYYGGRTVPFLGEAPRAPTLLHFGTHDPIIPPADVGKHRAALPDAVIHLYDAGHGFNCDQRKDYDAAASALAFERTLAFFRQHLS